MKKKTLKLALSIEEPEDGRANAGHLRPIRNYEGYIQGKKIKRSSRWWAMFKNQTEEKSVGHGLVTGRVYSGWSEEAATGAYKGETKRQYYARTGNKQKAKHEAINNEKAASDAFNKFSSMRF